MDDTFTLVPSKTHQEYLLGVSLLQKILGPEKSAMFLDVGDRWPVLYMVESLSLFVDIVTSYVHW